MRKFEETFNVSEIAGYSLQLFLSIVNVNGSIPNLLLTKMGMFGFFNILRYLCTFHPLRAFSECSSLSLVAINLKGQLERNK